MNTLRLAWRNIWRNGKRTAITLTAMVLSTATLIASYGLMLGMIDQIVNNVTNLHLGEVQIHGEGYLAERSLYDTIDQPERILKEARAKGYGAAPRSFGYGLLSNGPKSAGAQFWGVDPQAERQVGDLPKHLLEGDFLSGPPAKAVLLGRKLALSLKAPVGSELVVVVQAADGSLGNELYRVAGIFKTLGEGMDRSLAIVQRKDFADLFAAPAMVHEIAINTRAKVPLEAVASSIRSIAPKEDVRTWRQLMPPLSDMVNLFDVVIWMFALIFFLAAGLGVLNTMLMATYERIPEFGLIKALGASPWRILRDITAEAFLLGLASTLVGGTLGVAMAYVLQVKGIDLTGFGTFSTGGVAFDPVWRATLAPRVVVQPIVVMWIISIVASLYPASKAARLDPVRALTHV